MSVDAEQLAAALDTAIQAAREAGELIRDEFYRPGGPRGPRGVCPVDEEAEAHIRAAVRARFPEWSFYGEESGRTGEPSEYHWLVDPHDGTSAFQAGHRGTSVSIALLKGAELMLGVVYAPCPPVGHEDLITWVQGGEVVRNGVTVDRKWPEAGPDAVVLLSTGADRKPTANLALIDPNRFIAVPSIAYRLALAAVGEGDVAVSAISTFDYDFAAGHAIVVGTGGVVMDADGQEPVYSVDEGRKVTSKGLLVGGAPALVPVLVERRWSGVVPAPVERPNALAAVRPPNRVPREHYDRAIGIMLGQLVGDALGAQVEFEPSSRIAQAYPQGVRAIEDGGPFDTIAGQPTDDSEMALGLARALVDEGRYEAESAARAYARWYASRPFDIGTTTRAAGSAGAQAMLADGPSVAEAMRAAALVDSQSNGALMRISPLAIFGFRDATAAIGWAMEDARLTHPHPVCQASNAAFVAALVAGLEGQGRAQMHLRAVDAVASLEGRDPVLQRLEAARHGVPVLDGDSMGWCLHALQNAFYELLHAASFEEGLVATVGRGGDTDTNGAITGALLGAAFGGAEVPLGWRRAVLSCRPGGKRPRSADYWPTDALLLTAHLLAGGSGQARSA